MARSQILNLTRTIAKIAHRGQTYGELDYFTAHVDKVASSVADDPRAVVLHVAIAYLHDVLEDTYFTETDLLNLGVPENIVKSVVTLTRLDGETYFQYIDRVTKDYHAALVKWHDLSANINGQTPPSMVKRNITAIATVQRSLL